MAEVAAGSQWDAGPCAHSCYFGDWQVYHLDHCRPINSQGEGGEAGGSPPASPAPGRLPAPRLGLGMSVPPWQTRSTIAPSPALGLELPKDRSPPGAPTQRRAG